MTKNVFSVFFVFLSLFFLDGTEIRVLEHQNVPQIHVDGKPVHAHWFWGGPTALPHPIHKGEQMIELERIAIREGCYPIQFHLRFAHKPVTLWIDNFEVVDATTGGIIFAKQDFESSTGDKLPHGWNWHQTRNSKVCIVPRIGYQQSSAMQIDLIAPKVGFWPDFHIYTTSQLLKMKAGNTYKIRLWIRSTTETSLNFAAYQPGPLYIPIFSDNAYFSQIKHAKNAGVNFLSFLCPFPWPRRGEKTDWDSLDSAIELILKNNPDAKIIPRFLMYPPAWWLNENPNELMKWDSENKYGKYASVSSLKYRRDAGERLRLVIEHLEEKYPDHIAGYHPCGQETHEWFYHFSWEQGYHGFSICEERAFRNYLKQKYKSDRILQEKWRNTNVSLENALAPTPQMWQHAPVYGCFLLPGLAQPMIDHNLFLQKEMADTIAYMAKIVRTATKGRKLSIFFYGYGFEFAAMSRMGASGHLALERLLTSPDIDIFVAPISYSDRDIGCAGLSMSVGETILRNKKMWFYEDDTRTYLAQYGSLAGLDTYAKNQWETRQVLMRNVGQEIIRNYGSWWMDLLGFGWFNDPNLWSELKTVLFMEKEKLENPQIYLPEIACIFDENSAVYTKNAGSLTYSLLRTNFQEFSRTGISFGQYSLQDILNSPVDSKLYVMLNPWVLDAQQRIKLQAALTNRFVLWCHAPGILDPDKGLSLELSEQVTGYKISRLKSCPNIVKSTMIGQQLGLPATWKNPAQNQVLMAIEPKDGDQILAQWPDGSAAVVMGKDSIFSASPSIPKELIWLAASQAGIHCYINNPCVFYTDKTNFVIHAIQDGKVTLTFPKKCQVYDVFSGQTLTAGEVKSYTLDLKFGETRLLRTEPLDF